MKDVQFKDSVIKSLVLGNLRFFSLNTVRFRFYQVAVLRKSSHGLFFHVKARDIRNFHLFCLLDHVAHPPSDREEKINKVRISICPLR